MSAIDLNADGGESAGWDELLMPLVTSVNIACGAHAGDEHTMAKTMALAQQYGLQVGAHPGFADREGMGRRDLELSSHEIEALVMGQLAALRDHGKFCYVKPHGALYTMSARDARVADAIASGVRKFDGGLALLALAGSESVRAARSQGLKVVSEAFADRRYDGVGQLVKRGMPGAMIETEDESAAQVISIARRGEVQSIAGNAVRVAAESVCIHGDSGHAVSFARRLRTELAEAGISVKAFLK